MKRTLIVLLFIVCILTLQHFFPGEYSNRTVLADTPIVKPPVDTRVNLLRNFFVKYKCSEPYYIEDYIKYADKYELDYRLLPAISLQESTCGKHDCYHTSNYWGWGSCKGVRFGSVPEGIEFVTEKLANNHYYSGKSNYQKMRSYNPNPEYADKIIKLINQIK